jgi:hypothetical protein
MESLRVRVVGTDEDDLYPLIDCAATLYTWYASKKNVFITQQCCWSRDCEVSLQFAVSSGRVPK